MLVFDYRTFGGSDGEPRHWVSPRRHVEDWRAALAFVKVRAPRVCPGSGGLWAACCLVWVSLAPVTARHTPARC